MSSWHVYLYHVCSTLEARTGHRILGCWSCSWLWAPLRTEPGPSARAPSALKHGNVSLAPVSISYPKLLRLNNSSGPSLVTAELLGWSQILQSLECRILWLNSYLREQKWGEAAGRHVVLFSFFFFFLILSSCLWRKVRRNNCLCKYPIYNMWGLCVEGGSS